MIQIEIDQNSQEVFIKTPFSQKDRCTRVPGGKWVSKKRAWQYLLTPATASSIRQSFGKLVPDKDAPIFDELASRLDKAQDVVKGTHNLKQPATNSPPWKHQLVSYNIVCVLLGLGNEDNGNEDNGNEDNGNEDNGNEDNGNDRNC